MNNAYRLLPLAIGVAVVGGLTWVLLDRDVALGRWLLAALLLGHGLAHFAFVVPAPEPARTTGAGIGIDAALLWLVFLSGWRPDG
jgi:hypothetical protein